MATFRRALVAGATYFFTVTTYQRQQVLTNKPFYDALKQSIHRVKKTHPFKIEAFVLLPVVSGPSPKTTRIMPCAGI